MQRNSWLTPGQQPARFRQQRNFLIGKRTFLAVRNAERTDGRIAAGDRNHDRSLEPRGSRAGANVAAGIGSISLKSAP